MTLKLLLSAWFQEYLEEDAYKEVEDLAERLQAYKGNKPIVRISSRS